MTLLCNHTLLKLQKILSAIKTPSPPTHTHVVNGCTARPVVMFFHNNLRNKLLGKISTRVRAERIQETPEQRENVEGGGLGLEVGGSSEISRGPTSAKFFENTKEREKLLHL